jgi:hypothetical protein
MSNKAVGGHSSETYSHPIDMIIIVIKIGVLYFRNCKKRSGMVYITPYELLGAESSSWKANNRSANQEIIRH